MEFEIRLDDKGKALLAKVKELKAKCKELEKEQEKVSRRSEKFWDLFSKIMLEQVPLKEGDFIEWNTGDNGGDIVRGKIESIGYQRGYSSRMAYGDYDTDNNGEENLLDNYNISAKPLLGSGKWGRWNTQVPVAQITRVLSSGTIDEEMERKIARVRKQLEQLENQRMVKI